MAPMCERKSMLGLSLLAVLLVLTTAASGAAREVDVDSLLRVSVGGERAVERLLATTGVYTHSTGAIGGQPSEMLSVFEKPDKVYLQIKFGELEIVQAYNGEVAWTKDFSGAVSMLGEVESRQLKNQAYFQSSAFLTDDGTEVKRVYEGMGSIDGVERQVIAFIFPEGDTVRNYIDPSTGHITHQTSRADNVRQIIRLEDYETINGVLMSMSNVAVTIPPTMEMIFAIDSIAWDPDLPPGFFDPPGWGKKDYHFPADADAVALPFVLHDGHIYVKAVINGALPVWLILDSGASSNVFDMEALVELKLESAGKVPAQGVGGFDEVDMVKTDSIAVGDLVLYEQVAGFMDLQALGLSGMDDDPFGGILGYDFLSRFPLLLDYEARTITVYNPDTFEAPEGGAEIAFEFYRQVPFVTCKVGETEGRFVVDLGNAHGVILHHEFVEETQLLGYLTDVEPYMQGMAGIGGDVGGRQGIMADFEIGGAIHEAGVPAIVPETSDGLTGSFEVDGNIGNKFLRSYKVLFDYGKQRLYLYRGGTDSN